MPYTDFEPLRKQLTIVVGLTVVGFMAFGLALSFYRNILFEQKLKGIEQDNHLLAGEIDTGYDDLEYYKSEQYKDKYLKESLGLVQPGEKVLIITKKVQETTDAPLDELTQSEYREAAYLELLRHMPVMDHWKLFLFHRDRIEELKKNL